MTLAEQYVNAINYGHTDTILRIEAKFAQLDAEDQQRRDRPDAILSAALWYASVGIAVFPLQPRGKTPATRNGFKDATTDEQQIRAWWNANPTHNIGLPTGRQFDVIDVDGPAGITTMYFGPAPLIDSIPTLIGKAFTARDGGQHLYIPAQPGRGNKAAVWPGVDYRGTGGYVVAPPSVGANGRRYTWATPINIGQVAA